MSFPKRPLVSATAPWQQPSAERPSDAHEFSFHGQCAILFACAWPGAHSSRPFVCASRILTSVRASEEAPPPLSPHRIAPTLSTPGLSPALRHAQSRCRPLSTAWPLVTCPHMLALWRSLAEQSLRPLLTLGRLRFLSITTVMLTCWGKLFRAIDMNHHEPRRKRTTN